MRFALAVALLAATALYGAAHPPENLAVGRGALRAVPTAFGPWNGTELSFENAVVEELRADDLLIRRYARGGDAVWLCIVYHRNRRYGAHDPQLCYDSQGYLVDPPRRRAVATPAGPLDVQTFVARRGREARVVWYWWSTEGLTTADADAFRRRMAIAGALENRSWGAFVRVETIARDGDLDAASARVADFSGRVARALPDVFARAASPPARVAR